MHIKTQKRFFSSLLYKFNRAKHTLPYYTRKYLRKFIISLFLILGLLFFSWLVLFINKLFFRAKRASMDRKIYKYINKTMDEILKLKTRYEQNTEFASLKPALPIQPLKMTLTTAVFLLTDKTPPVVLKRIIVNKKSPIYEDKLALEMNHRHVVRSLSSEIKTYEDVNNEKQTLIWLYMEYLPIRITHKSVNKDENTLRHIARDVLKGLDYLHKQKIAHLDLKIANIMADNDENGTYYKIIDFGYARRLERGEIKIPLKNYGTFPYKPRR